MKKEGFIRHGEALELSQKEVIELSKKHLNKALIQLMSLVGFTRQMKRAEGTKIYDHTGIEYTDFLGGFGSLNIGHNHPEVFEALEQTRTWPNLLQTFPGTLSAALANNLAIITPGNLQRSFFCNSGAEAVESAIKLARIATGKKAILAATNSFHGKTYGSLSATGQKKYQKPFQPTVPDFFHFPFNNLPALEALVTTHKPAAILLEPIQGEGGIIVPEDGYLKKVRQLCDQNDVLLILDEIQTGLGRTGYMFACEHDKVVPDIMCLAKSLSGGIIPIGAMVTSDKVWNLGYGKTESAALHTSTFGGNAMACTAAIKTLEILIENNLVEEAAKKGRYFLEKLKVLKEKYPLIKAVRGRGLLIGIEFKDTGGTLNKLSGGFLKKMTHEYIGAMAAGKLFHDHNIITAYTLNHPNVIRVEPPLTISYEEINQFIEALDQVLSKHTSFLSLAMSTGSKFLFGG